MPRKQRHKDGCSEELKPVPCGTTHIHRCDCAMSVRFRLRPFGCTKCDELHAKNDHSLPSFGESRCAKTGESGDEFESAGEVLESLAS